MDKKQYLTLEQNICGARVFLNVFGLILENVEEINEFSKLKIFNTKGEEVGMLYFGNGKVNIIADSNFGKLNASYNIGSFSVLEDLEDRALFAQWSNKIDYEVSSEDKLNFKGDMLIGCCMDTQLGIKCRTHSMMEYVENGKQVIMKFMSDGHEFMYEIKDNNSQELLDMTVGFRNSIIHIVIDGEYDESKHSFPYRKCNRIDRKSKETGEILQILSWAERYNESLSYIEKDTPAIGDKYSEEASIQKGLLMQEINPNFVNKIEEIKNKFICEDVSLFENLVDISFASYTDKEVLALFGFDRKKVNYQNGADNLVDAYYGIGGDNKFLSPQNQKRLLK